MGSTISTGGQKRDFEERLTRIRAGGENTSRHVYVGPVEESVGGRGRRKKIRPVTVREPRARSFFGELFMTPVAMAFGGLAVLAARVLAFHFLADQPMYAEYAWYADLGIAVVLALILRRLFSLSGGSRSKAFLAGFLVMLFFEALFVVRAPEIFTMLYSDAYVAELTARIGNV